MVALKEVAENTLHIALTAEMCDGRRDLLRKPFAVKSAMMTGWFHTG
jgi:hypothetical protein